MFSNEDLNSIPTVDCASVRVFLSEYDRNESIIHESSEIRFYKLANLGYTMSIYDADGKNIADVALTKDQMANLIIKAEIAQA